MTSRKIQTSYWAKPIPSRDFDYCAWFDGDEPNDDGQMAMGFGRTEQAAVADLIENHGNENDAPAVVSEVM